MHEFLSSIPPYLLFVVVAAIVGAESLGVPIPGEATLVAALLIGRENGQPLWPLFLAATAGAIIGDNIGYLIGRRAGIPVLEAARRRMPRAFSTERILSAAGLMLRFGAWAIFAARFFAILRLLSGPLAGTLRFPYRTFAIVNACGAVVWAGSVTVLTALADTAISRLAPAWSWTVGAVVLVGLITVLILTAVRANKRGASENDIESTRPLAELLKELSDTGKPQSTKFSYRQ